MAEEIAALEFFNSKPQTTNSVRDWLREYKKKAEILTLKQFLQCVLESLGLKQQRKMKWKPPVKLVAKCGNLTIFTWLPHVNHVTIKRLV